MATEGDSSASSVQAYPNPARNTLRIELVTTEPDTRIQLSDQLGETRFMQDINGDAGARTFDIDLSTLPEGMYFLIVRQGRREVRERIVVKR